MAYETFTECARKAMWLANQEALRFSHEYVGVEHLLLGLLGVKSGVACGALNDMGTEPSKIYDEVEKSLRPNPNLFMIGRLPQTPHVKKGIENALEEARSLMSRTVGTGHLLLGLLREQDGFAVRVLVDTGLNLRDVRSAVLERMKKQREPDRDCSDSNRSAKKESPQAGAEQKKTTHGGGQSDRILSGKITKQTIPALWEKFKQNRDDKTLRNRLIEHYTPIVYHRVDRLRRQLPPKIERDDLISAGFAGLMDAVAAFDPTRGVKFETFCIPRIQGAIVDELRSVD